MFIVFGVMFLLYLRPVGLSSLTAIIQGKMEWSRGTITYLSVFGAFTVGFYLSWLAYREAKKGRL
jgi:hypothetical protein